MNNSERLHGLDFCRAIFMVLGVFYHTALIYEIEQSWRVSSSYTSEFFSTITMFIHDFRMEAFYVIAGFFFMYIYKKNRKNFLTERVARAIVPLLFCGFTINYVMNIYSYNFVFDWGEINYYLHGQWLGHLWFLGNLIVYFIVLKPFCKHIDKLRDIGSLSLIILFVVMAPVLSILLLGVSKYTISSQYFFISFHSLLGYFPYFLLGCACCTWKKSFLSILNVKVFFISLLLYFSILFITNYGVVSPLLQKALERLSHGTLALAMISIFYNCGIKEGKVIKEISLSSYTIYLLHQPLVVLIYIFVFSKTTINIYLEYFLLVSLVLLASYSVHRYLVKPSKTFSLLFNGTYKKA
ncbi:acyltransferase family protein [Pseudoalteromonas sp. P1-25]|uniref:acyltransferase family protein n=1 Tax=Pseudoalteromonas sp. P1-25 TaxID=1723758 RepID=UPI0006D6640E|nr:acyltransferase family protein [Pseudoalteromonas sp. P1-25]KPZ55640.1 Glucans biosynthesis protein C [Pseudoalteromonas sp. P1-25]